MMHIKINDQDPFQPKLIAGMSRRHSNRGIDTETHRRMGPGMMAGRTDGTEGDSVVHVGLHDLIHSSHGGTSSKPGGRECGSGHVGVGIKHNRAVVCGPGGFGLEVVQIIA